MSRDDLYLLNGRYRLASPTAGLSFPAGQPERLCGPYNETRAGPSAYEERLDLTS